MLAGTAASNKPIYGYLGIGRALDDLLPLERSTGNTTAASGSGILFGKSAELGKVCWRQGRPDLASFAVLRDRARLSKSNAFCAKSGFVDFLDCAGFPGRLAFQEGRSAPAARLLPAKARR